MPSLVREQKLRPTEALSLETSALKADAEVRRLTAAAAIGDEAAFQVIYDRYQQRLLRFVLVLTRGDLSLAHDVVQSAFITAAAKLRRVESEQHLWNWLAKVTRQHAAKAWRHQDSRTGPIEELPEIADNHHPDSILEESLDAALMAMDSDDQQMIEWFYFDGLTHSAIADRLSTTPKAISSRLERARAKLRFLLTRKLSNET